MKNSKLLGIALLTSLMAFGCAQKEETTEPVAQVPAPAPVSPIPGVPNGGGSAPIDTTGTIPFTPVSKAMMEQYVASHPLNSPANYRISIKLKNAGDLRFAGEVKIMYEDKDMNGNYQSYTGTFLAPEGKNESYPSMGQNEDVGLYKSHYNYWYNIGNRMVFSGFFQDPVGAIILIIDNAINLGDGQGGEQVSGSIWFRNFSYSYAPQSTLRNCWFIYMGPYVCGSQTIINKSSLEPSDGYRKLGTFQGVVKSTLFAN